MVNQTPEASAYSANCKAVAKVFVQTSYHGGEFDQPMSMDGLIKRTGLSKEDVKDGIDNLGSEMVLFQDDTHSIAPHAKLYAVFDSFWMSWNPADDALTLAKAMTNEKKFPTDPSQISDFMAWEPRRLNPAMTFMAFHHLADTHDSEEGSPWIYNLLTKNAETSRYIHNMA